ncbi:DUF6348 family protein [Feifania hominis]|uniref:Uncharacterized protein n=1 Tax=Feifania hominis TaxID=2763660 RepID=A0A926HQV4_9FIRM|nr:DUF6348 family protein [Feifania hominis]MBC8536747.1 hypothetical protein [Feifania hominis]
MDEQRVIERLHRVMKDSRIRDNTLVLPDCGLVVTAFVQRADERFAQVVFTFHHESFATPIVEVTAGVGADRAGALDAAAANVALGALQSVANALRGVDCETVQGSFYREKTQFLLAKSPVQTQGRDRGEPGAGMWDIIGDELVARLGDDPVVFVKALAARTPQGVRCECKIDALTNPALTDILAEYAADFEPEGDFYLQKQYFVFRRLSPRGGMDRTDMETAADEALTLMADCVSREQRDALPQSMRRLAGTDGLACEFLRFLPEIVCQFSFLSTRFDDRVIVEEAGVRTEMYADQFLSYRVLYDMVHDRLQRGELTGEQMDRILLLSEGYRTICAAVRDGREPDEAEVGPVTLRVPRGYRPA